MSWSLNAYYTCVHLPAVSDATALGALLHEFAASTLTELIANKNHAVWDAFDAIYEEIEESADPQDAIQAVVKQVQGYLSEITYRDGGVSFVLGSEYDSEHSCTDLMEALATFLLPYSSEPYLLLCSAAFDNGGGYSRQTLLSNANGMVTMENTSSLLERLYQNPRATVGDLLPFTTAEPKRLVDVTT